MSKNLLCYNFSQYYNPNDFEYFLGSDGKISLSKEGLVVNSIPFTILTDHIKWCQLYKNNFMLCPFVETIFEAKMSGKQYINPDNIPPLMIPRIRNKDEDLRLASVALFLFDFDNEIELGIFLTNTDIYAFYERSPYITPGVFSPASERIFAAFTNVVLIGKRNPSDFDKLAIGINPTEGIIRWYIGSKCVFEWNKIGYSMFDQYKIQNYGGVEQIVQIKNIRVGFGTFDLLDAAIPNNYARDYLTQTPTEYQLMASALVQLETTDKYKELYMDYKGKERDLVNPAITFAYVLNALPDNNKAVKLFGQGSELTIQYLKVYPK